MAALRKDSDKASKLLVEIYDAARKPIAPGEPPLTRQQSDAALELFYFMAGQLEGVQANPTAEEKDGWAKKLAAGWAKLDEGPRKAIAQTPLTWAATRAGWGEMSDAEREEFKKSFAQMDVVKEIRAVFAKAKASAGSGDASAMMSRMQSNHQMSMAFSKMGYDSTMSSIASFRNMVDTRYHYTYRPK